MDKVIPIGSIRRLLHWARAQVEGKENPYTVEDGKADIEAVDEWVNNSDIDTGNYVAEKQPDWWSPGYSPPPTVIHYEGPDYKNELEIMPGWIRNYYFTGHPIYVGNPKWIGTPYEVRTKQAGHARVEALEETGRYKHRIYVMINFNEFRDHG